MSYVPPHLRNRPQQSRHQPVQPGPSIQTGPSNRQEAVNAFDVPKPSSRPRDSYGLSASRHAQPSSGSPQPRPSWRYDSTNVLESDPNDIKPRRLNRDTGKPGTTNDSVPLGKSALTDMELLGTVSRSGGVGDENDALKDFEIQEKYRVWIQAKLETFEKRFPEYHLTEIDAAAKEALEIINNILIYFRKLREGLIASRRLDDFAIEGEWNLDFRPDVILNTRTLTVYETSALYAIKARNHPQIISSLSILVPNGYTSAQRPQPRASGPKSLHERVERLDLNPPHDHQPRPKPYPRKGLFTSLLLLYDIVYRQSPRDFINRFFSLTQADISPQGCRRHRTARGTLPFIEADDPDMRYTWNVYQALSQPSSLWLNALSQPVVRLRPAGRGTTKVDQEVIYRTDPLQRIILSWATDRIRQDTWSILQKGYHPQLGLGLEWCSRLLLFRQGKEQDGTEHDWDHEDSPLDMRSWIHGQGGRVENGKVLH